jgi:hypothetical protein
MGTPQIIWIALMAVSLGISLSKHGEPKKGKNSFWTALISFGIQLAILTWGGFFK